MPNQDTQAESSLNYGNLPSPRRILLFCGFVVASQTLGIWGFLLIGEPRYFPSLLYKSLQLFSMESGGVEGKIPWQLETARWLAPLTLAGGLLGLAKSLLSLRIERWKARRLRGHHIVCGLGDKGLAIAADLLAAGEKVVALDPAPDPDKLACFRGQGGVHLPLEATSRHDLAAAGIEHAATFTALTPDDARNLSLAIAEQAAGLKTGSPHRVNMFIHIGSATYRDLLDRSAFLASTDRDHSRIRSFNSHANLARLLFLEYPFETAGHADGAVNTDREIHVIFPSFGADASAVIVHAARTGHYLGGRGIHFHLVGPAASDAIGSLLANYPSFERCCSSLNHTNIDVATDFGRAVGRILQENTGACVTVFPCFDTAPEHLATILRIHEESPVEMAFRIPLPNGMCYLLDPAANRMPLLSSRIAWFPDVQRCWGKEAVFNDKLDQVARIIHDNWHDETGRQIQMALAVGDHVRANLLRNKPAYRDWHDLDEDQKDANRSQADHIDVKIRAAGMDPHTLTKDAWLEWCESHLDVVQLIAQAEHERWAAHLWLAGWSYGTPRDDSRKIHNNLVPYDQLDEQTKQYDRNAVIHLNARK